ncbi:hypothetical protein G6F56_001022 [Rhizopus delemar]|nr:hypothetical protein G6F56_001022 [Rhizopus delemar]
MSKTNGQPGQSQSTKNCFQNLNDTDTAQFVNSIYKFTENNQFQTTTAVELYEQIEYLKSYHHEIESEEAFSILQRTSEQAKRLAVFGIVTAKTQEQEAKEYALKALRLPSSLKHLESESESSKRANVFDSEFIEQLH